MGKGVTTAGTRHLPHRLHLSTNDEHMFAGSNNGRMGAGGATRLQPDHPAILIPGQPVQLRTMMRTDLLQPRHYKNRYGLFPKGGPQVL